MSDDKQAQKKNILTRLKRIEGQVRGIQRMIDEDKECEAILIQIRAVRSALQSANKLIIKSYMDKCHTKSLEEGQDQQEALDKVLKLMTDFLE